MATAAGLFFLLPSLLFWSLFRSMAGAGERSSTPNSAGHSSLASAVYARSAKAVVGIRCRQGKEESHGSGAVVDSSGLVLTSSVVVPPGAEEVRVFFTAGRMAEAEPVLRDMESEACLLRIRGSARPFPFLTLARSRDLRRGEAVFALGNPSRSIEEDGCVALTAGVVSGRYELSEACSPSTYTGPVIETTAAVGTGVHGGPLLDERGELVGLLGHGFARERWLATAIPIDLLKPILGAGGVGRARERPGDDAGGKIEVEVEVEAEAGRRGRRLFPRSRGGRDEVAGRLRTGRESDRRSGTAAPPGPDRRVTAPRLPVSQKGTSTVGESMVIGDPDPSRKPVELARKAAERLAHGVVDTEHLLLGTLEAGGPAVELVTRLGIDPEMIRSEVESALGEGEDPDLPARPLTHRLRRALELAAKEARELAGGRMDSGHILLGLALEEAGLGGRILRSVGITEERLRSAREDEERAGREGP